MGATAEANSLKDQMRNILDEARMILPGVQALFGFQTIAVFNQRFEEMGPLPRYCHLAALMLVVVVAIGLVMAPAAWHRLASPEHVTEDLVRLSSKLISAALLPLAIAVAVDVGVVIQLCTSAASLSLPGAALALMILAVLWFFAPMSRRRRMRSGQLE